MIEALEMLLKEKTSDTPEITNEMISEWKSHPVTRGWYAKIISNYFENLDLISQDVPVDETERAEHNRRIGALSTLENIIDADLKQLDGFVEVDSDD